MSSSRLIQVLSIRSFFFLFLAEVFSQVAMNMANFILLILVFNLANSNTAVSGIVVAFTIPAIVFGLSAGIYVDIWDKKTVLFATNMIRAVLVLFLAMFHANLIFIYTLTFLIAIVTQFFIPAETPIIPRLVPKHLLTAANALFGLGIYGSLLVAYMLSGTFILVFGQIKVFIILALFFLFAAFFTTLIRVDKKQQEEEEIAPEFSFRQEARNAISLITKTRKIYQSLFLLTLSQIIILILGVIGPGYAIHLGIKAEEFPLLFITPAAFGTVLGAFFLGHFHIYSRERSALFGVGLSGFAIMLLSYGSHAASKEVIHTLNIFLSAGFDITIVHLMMVLAFLLGLANAFVFVPSNTILQEETSDTMRGKVYGALNALTGICSIFPVIIVGGLADVFGVGQVMTGMGATLLLLVLVRYIFK